MSRAQPLPASVGLVPLPRPLMTGEVLDASFRLFGSGLLRCLPYSGLAVLVLEMPTLYAILRGGNLRNTDESSWVFGISVALGVILLGALTLRLGAISRGERPGFRREIRTTLTRSPKAAIATLGALGFPIMLYSVGSLYDPIFGSMLVIVLALLLIWPAALLVVALPAFWCDGLGPFAAIAQAFRISRRRSWRMVGAILATTVLVAVFYALAAIIVGLMSPLMGGADVVLLATIRSMMALVVGAFGVPFVISMLIVAYEDLKLREIERKKAAK